MNSEEGWKKIIDDWSIIIDRAITTPEFLSCNKHEFITQIVEYLYTFKNYKSYEDRALFVYNTIVPLNKHFRVDEDTEKQTFISDIKDRNTLMYAIQRIKNNNFQWYRSVSVTLTQSIPSDALINSDGMAVGKGLKTAGNVIYRCLECGYVTRTTCDYWTHQLKHNNRRVRTFEQKILVNKIKF
tara:strand:+ start:429 stop:980 length:552 start_codon:yes stop_codon:yes gene_type:complete